MCGIAGVFLRDPSFECDMNAITTTLIDKIDVRGKHACGFVAIGDDGVLEWQKAAVSAFKFNMHRKPVPKGTHAVLAHTRWATQGDPGFMENNHPIKRGPFFIIHNGHVLNDFEMFRSAERQRYGQVDSEAIAARLSSFGNLSDLEKVMAEIRGGAAVAALDERDCRRLAIAKGSSSPLFVYSGSKIVIFASTQHAVEQAYGKHIGKLGEANLFELKEGDAWEWHDRTLIKRNFEVRRLYTTYTPSASTTWVPTGKIWDPEERKYVEIAQTTKGKKNGTKGKAKSSKRKDQPWSITRPAGPPGKAVVIPSDQEFFDCEHCGEKMHWSEVNYFRLPEEQVTFLVCEPCFDLLVAVEENGEDWLSLDSNDYAQRGGDRLFDDTEGPIDNFEGANRGILRHFLDGLL